MTEVQVSATNSYIPKGGGRGSFLWYSLMKTLTPQAIYFPIPPARNHQILGWKQLALSLSLQETVDLPKLKMLSSTEKNIPKIHWLFLKKMKWPTNDGGVILLPGKLRGSSLAKKQHPVLNIHQQEQLVFSIDKNGQKKNV